MSKDKIPTSAKDYLKSLAEIREVIRWIRAEVIDDKSRKYIKKMGILFQKCTQKK